jgi:glycosyltransferase involved in cell wall biosynthesis
MTTVNRALYLSHDGLTDPLGQSQILPYVVGLSAKGYQFTIISFEKTNIDVESENSVARICKEKNITWIPLPYHKRPPVLSTLYDLWVLRKTVDQVIQKDRISILHCRSYPMSLVGLAAKRKWGVKFIFDMRGFWVDERVEGGLWNPHNLLYKIIYSYFKRKEKLFLKEADCIVSLTNNAKEEIESWGFKTAPIKVIPTCVDLQLFNPQTISNELRKKKREELGVSSEEFLLVYAGSWGTWYLTHEIVKFFEILKRENYASKFLILTPDKVDQTGQDIIVRRAARKEMPLLLSCANGCVFFIKNSFSKKASSATKLGEMIAMKIPIVTNSGWGDIKEFASENMMVLENTSDDQLLYGARKLLNTTNTPKHTQIERLSLTFGVNLYNEVYQNLLGLQMLSEPNTVE